MEGFKEKKLQNILESIESSRTMSLSSFFVALGIPQVGRKTGKLLARYVTDKLSNIAPHPSPLLEGEGVRKNDLIPLRLLGEGHKGLPPGGRR